MKLGKLETRELIDDSAMNESYKTLRTNLLYTSDLKAKILFIKQMLMVYLLFYLGKNHQIQLNYFLILLLKKC